METTQSLQDRQQFDPNFNILTNTVAWDESDSRFKIYDGSNWQNLTVLNRTEGGYEEPVVSAVEQLSTEVEAEEKFNVFENTVQLPDPNCFPSNPAAIENLIERQNLLNILQYKMGLLLQREKERDKLRKIYSEYPYSPNQAEIKTLTPKVWKNLK